MIACCKTIALFTVNFSHLHYNKIRHACEAISGYFAVLARNCLTFTLDYIVMQMRKINRENGYCQPFSNLAAWYSQIHIFGNIGVLQDFLMLSFQLILR